MSYEEKGTKDTGKGLTEEKAQTDKTLAGNEPEEGMGEYGFIKETIKPREFTRKQFAFRCARMGLYGLIFGACVCAGYYSLRPLAQGWFRGTPDPVEIPRDDTLPEEGKDAQEKLEAESQQAKPKLDSQSFETIMDSVYEIAREARKCTVMISHVHNGGNTVDVEKNLHSVSGVVTADNGQELLILADNSICGDGEEWTITFADGSSYRASVKKQDRNTGLAIFSVPRVELSDHTWNTVKVAVLGNSNIVTQGDSIFALGGMFGYSDGVGYGMLSSVNHKETFFDGECSVLGTDLPSAEGGTGFLFNLRGEVIGLISPSVWQEKASNTANAYAISGLKPMIELLSNGESVPYIGVYGTAVSSAMQKQKEMPSGVYVVNIDPDSPAMSAGIQSGDIIWQVNGSKVTGLVTYQKAMLDAKAGERIPIRGMRLGADGYVEVDYQVTLGSKE